MAKSVKPLIGTSTTFSVTADTTNVNGATIRNDYPPSAQEVGAIYIHNDGTGGAVTITVKAQLYSGADWGPLHNVTDEDGSNVTFSANSDTDVEANMYEQSWWKENDGWRIVLDRSAGSTLLAGTATAVIR